jgi:hypothetical protein
MSIILVVTERFLSIAQRVSTAQGDMKTQCPSLLRPRGSPKEKYKGVSACVSESLKARLARLNRPSPYFEEAYVRSDEWKLRSQTHTPAMEKIGNSTNCCGW